MANGFRPFGNVPEMLQQLVASQPQRQALEFRMKEAQNNMVRSNLLTQFLINADLSTMRPSDITATVGAIMADPDLAVKSAEQRFKEGLFGEQRERLKNLSGLVEQFAPSGLTPEETARVTAENLRQGGSVEETKGLLRFPESESQRILRAEQAQRQRTLQQFDKARINKLNRVSGLSGQELTRAIDDTREAIDDLRSQERRAGLTEDAFKDLEDLEQRHRDLIARQDKLVGAPKRLTAAERAAQKEFQRKRRIALTRLNNLKRSKNVKQISVESYKAGIRGLFRQLGGGVGNKEIDKQLTDMFAEILGVK